VHLGRARRRFAEQTIAQATELSALLDAGGGMLGNDASFGTPAPTGG
jgi:hypothetical protein